MCKVCFTKYHIPFTMNTQTTSDWKARSRQRTIQLAAWTGAWLLTTALGTFGPRFLWESETISLLAVLFTLLAGLGMIFAAIRHLKIQDEMMQKIQLNAMAVALGVGVVGGLSYAMLDTINLIASDAEIGHLVILISITYLISVIVNYRTLQ